VIHDDVFEMAVSDSMDAAGSSLKQMPCSGP
jgi:hypothetical protein